MFLVIFLIDFFFHFAFESLHRNGPKLRACLLLPVVVEQLLITVRKKQLTVP